MLVTIVVCTHNRPQLLKRCLASLQPLVDSQTQLLVIDSAPSNSAPQAIAATAQATYVMTPRPGLDVARNLALHVAQGDIIAFIDDDAVATPGWIEALRATFADPSVAGMTGRVLPMELRTPGQRHFEMRFSFDRGSDPIRFSVKDDRPWFPIYPYHLGTGCNMAFRRHVFNHIGLFDEALDAGTPTGGGGDLDIFRRLLMTGYIVVYNPDALVYHQHRLSEAATRHQFWSYGKGFTAVMSKILLTKPELHVQVLRITILQMLFLMRLLVERIFIGRGVPVHLVLLELSGNFVGPIAFFYSLKRVQRTEISLFSERTLHLQSPE